MLFFLKLCFWKVVFWILFLAFTVIWLLFIFFWIANFNQSLLVNSSTSFKAISSYLNDHFFVRIFYPSNFSQRPFITAWMQYVLPISGTLILILIPFYKLTSYLLGKIPVLGGVLRWLFFKPVILTLIALLLVVFSIGIIFCVYVWYGGDTFSTSEVQESLINKVSLLSNRWNSF